ncbi:MAG: hypothetical protein JXA03_07245 [Bacteroidales bacterium]|nr:hypothetical protein [Bacteroidales bacterium]
MKTLISILLAVVFITVTGFSQSIERYVVASSGDHYSNANISLSWTLGEPATSTWTAGNIILTEGFQQPDVIEVSLKLDLTMFMEGPFNGADMNTNLNTSGSIPLSQPYNTAPWNYSGTEAVAAIPSSNVVDWVLIELRDAPTASSATQATRIARQALFVLKNGTVTSLDGSSVAQFSVNPVNQLFAVVWHRNHVAIMSATRLTQTAGVFTYDFTSGVGQAYGANNAHKQVAPGIWGMIGGDGNGDEQINNLDKNDVWAFQAGFSGYFSGDFNLDNQVNNNDKNDVWNPNTGLGGQVPDQPAAKPPVTD